VTGRNFEQLAEEASLDKPLVRGRMERVVSWRLVLAIENTAFSLYTLFTIQPEDKWSTRFGNAVNA